MQNAQLSIVRATPHHFFQIPIFTWQVHLALLALQHAVLRMAEKMGGAT